MSKSLEDALTASKIEDFEHATFSAANGLSYYVERTDEGIIHHEKRVDAAGELIYDQGVPVAFAVGSGERGRSYLINDSGRMYASPISWFNWDQKWGFSPGYAADSNPRFERRVSDGCVACHAGRTTPQGHDLDRFAENPFPERSIGCERCHGPGADHIKFRSSTTVADKMDPIFNPERVRDSRRDAVCNQCHLQGRRRVVRAGRSEFDFVAGMNLSDNWIVFVKTASVQTEDAAAAVSQVEQMYASRCYRESKGELGCISCHAGHAPPPSKSAADFYRERCLQCHSSGKSECSEPVTERKLVSADDSCIACHMPKFPSADVHATQTDHRIRRRPEAPIQQTGKPERFRDAKMVLFEEPGVKVPRADLDRARGIFLGEQAAAGGTDKTKQAIDLLVEAIQANSKDVESRYVLGQALEGAGQQELAAQAWRQVLEIQPTHEDALEKLATLYHQGKNPEMAREYYNRLIEVNPHYSTYFGRFAHVLGQLNDMPRAIEMAEKCLQLNPSLVQTHQWLAEAYRQVGNEEKAAYHEAKLNQFKSLKN